MTEIVTLSLTSVSQITITRRQNANFIHTQRAGMVGLYNSTKLIRLPFSSLFDAAMSPMKQCHYLSLVVVLIVVHTVAWLGAKFVHLYRGASTTQQWHGGCVLVSPFFRVLVRSDSYIVHSFCSVSVTASLAWIFIQTNLKQRCLAVTVGYALLGWYW